ncbi:uncharacterized transporter slc-17.2-like [Euwallacea similis]|uniref:uncharacterized transporter slc-17.2-like n=1 Tax=Euwallacea similis TaxID=1736056 RepID=UPI00344D61DC
MSWKIWKQTRHVLIFQMFMGAFTLYMCRINLSMVIVAVRQNRYEVLANGTKINIGPELDWSGVEGYLLSAFFYGFTVTPIIGGILARFTGGKAAFGLTVAGTSTITLVGPWLAEWSAYALLASRVCIGLLEGVTFPSLYILLSSWIPPNEKTRATSMIHAGNYAGTIFALLFFGYLAEVAGWRTLFWFPGGCGIIWLFFWWLFAADSPASNKYISKKELHYIQDSLKSFDTTTRNPVPWKKFLASGSVWAFNVIIFCDLWGFHTIVSLIPMFYDDIYDFEISQTGVLSALPYICLIIFLGVVAPLADVIIKKGWTTEIILRKTYMVSGYLLQAVFLLGAVYWNDISGTVFCLVMTVSWNSLTMAVLSSLPLDLTRQWSSVVYGFGITWGSIAGMLSPTVAGYIVSSENPTLEQWQIVFYITAGLYVIATVVFLIFGSVERLRFDETDEAKIDLN